MYDIFLDISLNEIEISFDFEWVILNFHSTNHLW